MERDRKTFIGGSDAAGVLGLSRWKTPLQVWAEKTGQIIPEDISGKLCVKLGVALEDTVAKLFEEETGKKVQRVNETRFHKDYDFLGASLDRKVVGESAFLECKTASAFKAKEWDGEDIPQEYIIQCLHYLAVTGYEKAYIAVLIGNQDFKWKEITRDEALLNNIINKEVSFWNDFVVPNIMPMTLSSNDSDTLYKLFPKEIEETVIELGDEMNQEIELLQALKQDLKSLEGQITQKENVIKAMLQDNEAGVTNQYKVTWKEQTRKSLDTAKIKELMPMIWEQNLKETKSRVFKINKNKETK